MPNARGASGVGGLASGVAILIVEYLFPHAEPWLTGLLLILFVILITIFVTLLLLGGRGAADNAQHIHLHLGDQIRSELAALDPSSVNSTPSVVVAQPSPAPPRTAVITALEQPDIMAATGHISPPSAARTISPLYVGQIIISASQLANGSIEIAVRAFNGSSETIALDSVGGVIFAGVHNANGARLPLPTYRTEDAASPIPPNTEFMAVLDQSIPEALVQSYLRALDDPDEFIAFDFRDLVLRMRVADDANITAALPLWQGATIRRRDDIFTGRMYMATLSGMGVHVQ